MECGLVFQNGYTCMMAAIEWLGCRHGWHIITHTNIQKQGGDVHVKLYAQIAIMYAVTHSAHSTHIPHRFHSYTLHS